MARFDVFTDPGHGWLKVPRSLLDDLEILHKITRHSYQRGEFVYLEEDQDCSTFFAAYRARFHVDPPQRLHPQSNRSSKIRTYESFALSALEQQWVLDNIVAGT